MLEVGAKAPEFTLPDKDGNSVSLTDFTGKKVVLYFYPRLYPSGLCFCRVLPGVQENQRSSDWNQQRLCVLPPEICGKVRPAIHPAFRPGTDRHPSLRCMAGEKALWQGEHGCGAIYLCD